MIMHADGHPVRRRYSVGVVGSLLVHVALVAAVLSQAGTTQPADPFDARGGSGRYDPRHSSALLRSGQYGGDPTGTAGAMSQPMEVTPWPVRQAERFGLRLAIGQVIDHVWQSTLFAIAVGLLTLAFRRNRARLRYALWFSVSVKFLVPFSMIMWLGSVIGSSVFAVLGTFGPLGTASSPGPSGSSTVLGTSWSLLQDLARHPLIGGIGHWLTATGTVALWPSTFTVSEVAAAWLALALLGIWTCGFFAIVAFRIRLSRQLWDVALTSRRVELLDVKVPARLQVGLADGLLEPGVIGWLNPVLLLPADIERHLTRPEIEAIVAHELCHVRRLDNLTAAIHMVAEAIFWFHPMVWWLGARLVDERERACDEHVLCSVGAPGPYAQGILNVCKRYVESPLASVSGVGSANVRQRIDAILANRVGEATGPWKKVLLSGIILCVVIVPLAAGALGASPAEPVSAQSDSVSGALGYALVLARDDGRLGPDLRPAGPPGMARERCLDGVRPGELCADAITLPRLAAELASVAGREVEDRTGLAGVFSVRLTWTPESHGPSLASAVQQQLGLRLVALTPVDNGPSNISP
jgi:beta-lactamase regulating signal transducer with metallopeptidase domain